ncbi:hypothetical protein T484DRAFT_1915820, partial [Baffinella frigidus]
MRIPASLSSTVWILLSLAQPLSSIPGHPEPCVPMTAFLQRHTTFGVGDDRLRGGGARFDPASAGSPVAYDSVPKKPAAPKARVGVRKKAEYFEGGGGAFSTPSHFRGVHPVPPGQGSGETGEEYQAKYMRKIIGTFPSVRAAALAYDFRMLALREAAAGRAPAYNFADAPRLFEQELEAGRDPEKSVMALANDAGLADPAAERFLSGIGGVGGSRSAAAAKIAPRPREDAMEIQVIAFSAAREIARGLGLKVRHAWAAWLRGARAGGRGDAWGLPMRPEVTYKGSGFTTWEDFLGYDPPGPEMKSAGRDVRDLHVAGFSEIRPSAARGDSIALPASEVAKAHWENEKQEWGGGGGDERALAGEAHKEARRLRMEQRLRDKSTVEDFVAPQWGWRLCNVTTSRTHERPAIRPLLRPPGMRTPPDA